MLARRFTITGTDTITTIIIVIAGGDMDAASAVGDNFVKSPEHIRRGFFVATASHGFAR